MKLSVIVIAYNQEHLIEQTIRSIANQQTTFDFQIIVGNDASSDGTIDVLHKLKIEYDNLIIIDHKENQGIVKNFMSVYNAAQTDYVSSIGGDDYWIDPNKLQKAFDFLLSHPDYALYHTAYKTYNQHTKEFNEVVVGESIDQSLLDLEDSNPIAAPTVMYRKSALPELGKWFEDAPHEDWALWNMFAQKGKIRYCNDVTTVYRKHDSSAYASLDKVKILMWRMRAKSFIHSHILKKQMNNFYSLNKTTFLSVLQDNSLSNKDLSSLFDYIEKQGVPKISFLVLLLAGRKNRFLNSLSFRLFNKKY